MDKQTLLDTIIEKFPRIVIDSSVIKEKRIIVRIDRDSILDVAEYLYKTLQLRFIIISAYHTKNGLELLYHFSDDASGVILNIHVILSEEQPEIESLANMLSAANWIEREVREIIGITFLNHPQPEKLLSEGNWEDGVYPYRKNFK